MSSNVKEEFNYFNEKINFKKSIFKFGSGHFDEYYKLIPDINELCFGKNIITKSSLTDNLFNNLTNMYNLILNLLELNKENFKKKISKKKYVFNNSNFIFNNNITGNQENDFNTLFKQRIYKK